MTKKKAEPKKKSAPVKKAKTSKKATACTTLKKVRKRKNPSPIAGECEVKEPHEYTSYGWYNPKYNQSMVDRVADLYKNGESDIEVSVALGIDRGVFYDWINKHPEFAKEVSRGRQASESWWRTLGRAGAAGKVKANAALWFGNMKNRFGWRDNMDINVKNVDEVKQVKSIVAKIKKHEKEV